MPCSIMSCLNPIWMYDTGRVSSNGKRVFSTKCNPRLPFESSGIPVPCGKCAECKRARAAQWAARMRLETFSSPSASFITLTYADNPKNLIKEHIQRFLKRLRNAPRDFSVPPFNLRYFVAGEYGSKRSRPHWHGIMFGVDMLSEPWQSSMAIIKDGFPVYTSKVLEQIWSYGFVTVDRANDVNCKYVSKYITKDGSCCLHSQGLGRSPFVSVIRCGRSVQYHIKNLFRDTLDNGLLFIPDRRGLSPIGIPKDFDRYLERCEPSLFERVKARRSEFVRNLPFDRYSVGERLSISNHADMLKQNQKGVLHEQDYVCDS